MLVRSGFLVLIAFAATATTARAADESAANDWPQFRGPNRDGVSSSTGLLKEWPSEGPPLIWETKGAGRGYSSLAITGGRIYTQGDNLSTADDKDEYLSCFDDATGEQIWIAKLAPAWNRGQPDWQGSRSTPTVDGDRIYAIIPEGALICLAAKDGQRLWSKSLKSDFGGDKADGWGYGESPLVDGDVVVCTPGKEQNTVVALDKKTGAKRWSCSSPGNRGAGHSSIVVATVGSTRVYVQSTGSGLLGVRASDGELLWTYPIDRTTAVIPTPIVRDDLVFFSVGYNRGGALLRQAPDNEGGVNVEEVYPLKTELNNKHGGVVAVGDKVYGDTNDSGVPFAADLRTGKVIVKKRGAGRGSAAVVAADGCLYFQFADGTVSLVDASDPEMKTISSFKAPHSGTRPSWSHPVVVGGKLYLRIQDWILCYDVRQK